MHFRKLVYPFPVRLLRVLALALAVLAVACLLAMGMAFKQLQRMQGQLAPLMQQGLSRALGREVRIGAVHLRGLNSLVIEGIRVADSRSFTDGTALAAPRAIAHVNLLALALRHGQNPLASVGRVTLIAPRVAVSRSQAGRWDFQDIIDRINTSSEAMHADYVVEGGDVAYRDAHGFADGVAPLDTNLVNVNAQVHTRGDGNYVFRASAQDAADHMGPMAIAGAYSGRTSAGQVTAVATRIPVTELERYLPADWPITFANGTAALRVRALIRNLPDPHTGTPLPATELTATLDIAGVGLRVRDMAQPIMATAGRLRLQHDPRRYPRGSQLEFQNVQAQAGNVPLTINGRVTDLDLFDLAHAKPRVDVTVNSKMANGEQFLALFPRIDKQHGLQLGGPLQLSAHLLGKMPDIMVDATTRVEHVAVAGAHGDGVAAQVFVEPAVGKGQPTVQTLAHVQKLTFGATEMTGLAMSLKSTTPLEQWSAGPRLFGRATAGQMRTPWGTVATLNGNVVLDHSGLQIHDLHAGIFGGAVSGTLNMPARASAEQPVLRVAGDLKQLDLQQLARQFHVDTLRGSAGGTLSATLDRAGVWAFDARLNGHDLIAAGKHAADISTTLHAQLRAGTIDTTIADASAATDYGHFTVKNGTWHWDTHQPGAGTLQLPVHGEGIPLRAFGYSALDGTGALDGVVSGDPLHPTIDAQVSAVNGILLGHAYTQARGEVTAGHDQLTFHHLVFSRPDMTLRIADSAQGYNPLLDAGGLVAQLELHGAPLRDVLALFDEESPWPVTGGVQGTMRIQPVNGHLTVAGTATIPHPLVVVPTGRGPYPLHLDQLALTFSYANRALRISDAAITRGGTTLRGSGTIGAPEGQQLAADLSFTGNGAQLADIPLDLFGLQLTAAGPANITTALHGVLQGTGPQPLQVAIGIDSPQAQMNGLPLGAIRTDLLYAYRPNRQQLQIRTGNIDNAAFQASLAGNYLLSEGRWETLSVNVPRIDLAAARGIIAVAPGVPPAWRVLAPALAGHGQLTASITGAAEHPDANIAFGLRELAINGAPLPNVQGSAVAETVDGHYRVQLHNITAADPTGTAQASVTGTLDEVRGPDIQFTAHDIAARTLTAWVGKLPVDGSVSLSGRWSGAWTQPVADADVQVDHPRIAGFAPLAAHGHLHLANGRLSLANGQVNMPQAVTLAVDGQVPLRLIGRRLLLPRDETIALHITLPRQTVTAFATDVALAPDFSGTFSGAVTISGTLDNPRIDSGWLGATGSAELRPRDPALPNRLQDLAVRLEFAGNAQQQRVTVAQCSATLDRLNGGTRARNFTPGWVATQGTVTIPAGTLDAPDAWGWNLYANVVRLPLPASLVAVPRASGFLHLTSADGAPVIEGTLLAEHVKVKEPKVTAGTGSWTAERFDPRFSVLLQVGDGVKISRGLFTVTLRPTPLPRPPLPAVAGDTPPDLTVHPGQPAFADLAAAQHPGAGEMTGTWGTLTGTLSDPRLYARFEVDSGKLSFPLNLFSSVRNARGRVTYSRADGPNIAMGIHDPAAASTTAAKPSPVPATGLTLH